VNKPYSLKRKTTLNSFTDPQIPYYFVLWSHKATLKMPRRQLQKKFCGQVDKDAFGWMVSWLPQLLPCFSSVLFFGFGLISNARACAKDMEASGVAGEVLCVIFAAAGPNDLHLASPA